MNNFFQEFEKVSSQQWEEKIIADLKGKSPDLLEINDEIEGISLKSYQHHSQIAHNELPGQSPFTRGMLSNDNSWNNATFIQIQNEENANKFILKQLMRGSDSLILRPEKDNVNWKKVLKDVQLDYIKVQFEVKDLEEIKAILNTTSEHTNIQFNIDFIAHPNKEAFDFLSDFNKNKLLNFCTVNGFGIQQIGGNCAQEIAFSLTAGHEYLVQLMDNGLSIDDAAACINFQLGIGSNYFNEIAKIRTLKRLWAKIISAYAPKHNCSHHLNITAKIGHTNKSLHDPHTNLLRQTTETLSALNSGVATICVLPYNLYSTLPKEDNPIRMATNIPLILKEEAYIDKVIDPSGGSYSMEVLTNCFSEISWQLFLELEEQGTILETKTQQFILTEIKKKRQLKVEKIASQEQILIGINKFPPIKESEYEWTTLPSYLGVPFLNFEQELKSISE